MLIMTIDCSTTLVKVRYRCNKWSLEKKYFHKSGQQNPESDHPGHSILQQDFFNDATREEEFFLSYVLGPSIHANPNLHHFIELYIYRDMLYIAHHSLYIICLDLYYMLKKGFF
ncbi:hypothetical protein ACJX0J_016525, partial [Zea mays]